MWLHPVFDQVVGRLSLSRDPRWIMAGLWLMDRAVPSTAKGLQVTLDYAHARQPLARYFAARRLGRFATADNSSAEAWRWLQVLALDPDRLVREGAAWGLAAWLAADPASLPALRVALANPVTPHLLRRAIVVATLPVIRDGPPDRLDAALELLDAAIEHGGPVGIAAAIVGRQVAARDPGRALGLVERWAGSNSPLKRRAAARTLALSPTLRRRCPAQPDAAGAPTSAVAQPGRGFSTTADLPVPDRLIDQIIGQERAVEIVRLAARQRRFVLFVGEPGTGKSLLASAMAELMPAAGLEDVLIQPNSESRISPRLERVPAGRGAAVIQEQQAQQRVADASFSYLFWVGVVATAIVTGFLSLTRQSPWPALGGVLTVLLLWVVRRRSSAKTHAPLSKVLINNGSRATAPFVDATGFHAGALLGDVRHDPFQSGGFETPPHELVEPGAIHLAHGGVLFIDEASTLSLESQQSLLTAIQEKRFPISGRSLGSSGAMVRTGPVPCDFVLVLAGNREDVDKMHPALRSRMRGYGYEVYLQTHMPDTPDSQAKLSQFVAQEVRKDGRIPHFTAAAVAAVIDEARRRSDRPGHLTARLRELGGLVRAAGDVAVAASATVVQPEHVAAAKSNALTAEEQVGLLDA